MQEPEKKTNNNKLVILIVSAVLVIAVFSVAATAIYQKTGFRGVYNQAVELAIDGQAEEAKKLFQSIEEKHYKDTDAFLLYCNSMIQLENGNSAYGYQMLDRMTFEHTTAEQNAVIEDFKNKIMESQD